MSEAELEQTVDDMQTRGAIIGAIDRLAVGLGGRCTDKRLGVYADVLEDLDGIDAEVVEDTVERLLRTRDNMLSPAGVRNEVKLEILRERPKQVFAQSWQMDLRRNEMDRMILDDYRKGAGVGGERHRHPDLDHDAKLEKIRSWTCDLDLDLHLVTQQNAARFLEWDEKQLKWWHIETIAEACTLHHLET